MASQTRPTHGLDMLQAASIVIAAGPKSSLQPLFSPCPPQPTPSSLSALLNPAPTGNPPALPAGYVFGKDGKIKKKRGRKPTPGLTDEDRRQARLLKNRRTAETSRRRKLALLNQLTAERDEAKLVADRLRKHNDYLTARLARALNTTVNDLLRNEPSIAMRTVPGSVPTSHVEQSEVSRPGSTIDSDSDTCNKKS